MRIFYILGDASHGDESVIEKTKRRIEKILKQHHGENKKVVFFTELFKVDESVLIRSVINNKDWKDDPRKCYEPVIEVVRKYGVPVYPLFPSKLVGRLIRRLEKLDSALFWNFLYHYNLENPEISIIDIGLAHCPYFVSKLKSCQRLKNSKVYLYELYPALLIDEVDEEEPQIITI